MGSRLYRNASWVLGALLLYAIYSAVRIGAADFLSIEAADAANSIPALADASRKLSWARRLTPDDPERLDDSAVLALHQAGLPGVAPAEKKALLRAGLVHARSAVVLRPAYAYGWAILLRFKHELREYDAEFGQALRAVATLGPWEPGLQALALDVGMAAWPKLSPNEQEQVMAIYLRGMQSQPDRMTDILRSHAPPCADEADGECGR